MNDGYWFAPVTDDTSVLGQKPIGSKMETEVRIVREIYRNQDNGWSVYDVEDIEHHWFKISGFFPTGLKLDAYYRVIGTVKKGKYGLGLEASTYKSALPHSKNEIITVLRTLPRLNAIAPRVYDELGDDALDLILHSPSEVAARIKGVGEKLAHEWQMALKGLKESDVILEVLHEYKIPINEAKKLLEKYPDIIDRLKISPYFLSDEIRSFSFLKCDKIALDNGYPLDGQERLQRAMLYVVDRNCSIKGDCYMDLPDFIKAVKSLIDVSIDFGMARKMLSQNGPIYLNVGSHCISVDRDNLKDAMLQWSSCRTRARFSYVCVTVDSDSISMAISGLRSSNKLIVSDNRVYQGRMYKAETTVSRCLAAMKNSEYGFFENVETVMNKVCQAEGVELEGKQREAVLRFSKGRGGVFVLNGRAGCGKTFTLNIILKVLQELYYQEGASFSAKVLAPTGKAARVAEKATGLPAQTIHRALHLVADQEPQEDISIFADCVVIDEFSMVGVSLAAILLKAIRPGVKTIIMGDFEQLPSVEPGNVLKDIIASDVIPVVTLNVVKRQATDSGVLFNANKILEGEMITSRISKDKSLNNSAYIFKAEEEGSCRNRIVEMFVKLCHNGYAVEDIQVLCPQKKTDIGVDALNYFIQAQVNPLRGRIEFLSKEIQVHDENGKPYTVELAFREGDKVINTVNDYNMPFYQFKKGEGFVVDYSRVGIMNGESGRIARLIQTKTPRGTKRQLYVMYGPNQYALYEDDWSMLSMAYAITIHRSQGSQWPIVIAPVMLCNRTMLNRHLFYTLYTRASQTSILYGNEEAVRYAIENVSATKRKTLLTERLQQDCK